MISFIMASFIENKIFWAHLVIGPLWDTTLLLSTHAQWCSDCMPSLSQCTCHTHAHHITVLINVKLSFRLFVHIWVCPGHPYLQNLPTI